MFDEEIKRRFSSLEERFAEIESSLAQIDERFHCRLDPPATPPRRDLGRNGSVFLLNALTRSRYLTVGAISSINDGNPALAFLTVRSHFEITGAVAYFLKKLEKFYAEEIDFDAMDSVLYSLSLGGRAFPDPEKVRPAVVPKPVNVLTQVDSIDFYFKKMGGDLEKPPFRDCYDYLSEFCHPNMLGLTIGSNITYELVVEFVKEPQIVEESTIGILLNYLSMSLVMFINLFDNALQLLSEHEEMPEFVR